LRVEISASVPTPNRNGGRVARWASTSNTPSLQLIDQGFYWHSDHETSDLIPAPGLEATTRAYAKIITDVNGIDLKDLQPAVQR
jgi:hypothetical protein